jgi:hypothetical protein
LRGVRSAVAPQRVATFSDTILVALIADSSLNDTPSDVSIVITYCCPMGGSLSLGAAPEKPIRYREGSLQVLQRFHAEVAQSSLALSHSAVAPILKPINGPALHDRRYH